MIRLKTLIEQVRIVNSTPSINKQIATYDAKHPSKSTVKKTTKPVDKKITKSVTTPTEKPADTPNVNQSTDTIIFVSGLTTSVSGTPAYSVSQQKALLAKNVSVPIDAHHHGNTAAITKAIKQNPNATVVLFSAGCSLSNLVVTLMTNPTKLYIVEPYAISGTTVASVRSAVEKGTPAANVFVGPKSGRGLGIVSGATKTIDDPKLDYIANHWKALQDVGKYIK